MDPTDLVIAVLLAAIFPFVILAGFSPSLYKIIGRGLLCIPLIIVVFGIFGTTNTANDNNGFDTVTATFILYLGIILGVTTLGGYALFAVVNQKLSNPPTKTEG